MLYSWLRYYDVFAYLYMMCYTKDMHSVLSQETPYQFVHPATLIPVERLLEYAASETPTPDTTRAGLQAEIYLELATHPDVPDMDKGLFFEISDEHFATAANQVPYGIVGYPHIQHAFLPCRREGRTDGQIPLVAQLRIERLLNVIDGHITQPKSDIHITHALGAGAEVFALLTARSLGYAAYPASYRADRCRRGFPDLQPWDMEATRGSNGEKRRLQVKYQKHRKKDLTCREVLPISDQHSGIQDNSVGLYLYGIEEKRTTTSYTVADMSRIILGLVAPDNPMRTNYLSKQQRMANILAGKARP